MWSACRVLLAGRGGNRFVYVKDFDLANAFVKTAGQVGEINDRFVEITSGLLPADEVVTRGAYSLSFAGASSVSLKEALDAAHGHEHAADGGELTPEKKPRWRREKGGGDGHGHGEEEGSSPLWKYASGVLFVLLLLPIFTKKKPPRTTTKPQPRNPLKRRPRKPCSTK
jgi:cobalt-zinc-cadmium efflux system membrane fusion protein